MRFEKLISLYYLVSVVFVLNILLIVIHIINYNCNRAKCLASALSFSLSIIFSNS